MQIEVADLKATIISGLKKAWYNNFVMTGERNEDITPEYLTTAAVCYAFCNHIDKNGLNGQLVIRSEEMTSVLWAKALIRVFLKVGSKLGLKRDSDLREGNVDISISTKGNGFEQTFAVIENKGFLSFTQSGELYKGSRVELEKDLKRNAEFVAEASAHGGVEYSAFTFYLRDNQSVLKAEGKKFCQDKEKYFKSLTESTLNHSSLFSVDVEVKTLEDNLFVSAHAANHRDEHGCPAYMAEGTWHIAYGVISIYAPRKVVIQNKTFKPDLRELSSLDITTRSV